MIIGNFREFSTPSYFVRASLGDIEEVATDIISEGCEVHIGYHSVLVRKAKFRRWYPEWKPLLPGYILADIPAQCFRKVREHKHVFDGIIELSKGVMKKEVIPFFERVEVGEFNHDGPFGDLKPGEIMDLVGGIFEDMHFSFDRVVQKGEALEGEVITPHGSIRAKIPVDQIKRKAS